MSFIAIIPARYSSTRLPGKPLADIGGKPMVVHVMERALESGASRVIVATDHADVKQAVEAAGGEVCMTRADHHSGTERLAEVIEKCGFADDEIIVNIQGDEPLIPPSIIRQVAHNLAGSDAGWPHWRCLSRRVKKLLTLMQLKLSATKMAMRCISLGRQSLGIAIVLRFLAMRLVILSCAILVSTRIVPVLSAAM